MKTFALAIVFALAAAEAIAQSPQPSSMPHASNGAAPRPPMKVPDKFTNLKVLPKDIRKDQLVQVMRAFSQGLGQRCDFCHVLSLETQDFASDKKPEKQMARGMMGLVHKLNTDFFTYKDAPKATCFMCHHGEKKPTLSPPPLAGFGAPGAQHPDGPK
jgi:photosynthetic reaction center cytochrome c subunit